MTKPKTGPVPSRYDWRVVALRVVSALTTRRPPGEPRPLSIKELADRVAMDVEVLRKKLGTVTGRGLPARTPFTIDECGRIAELYKAPGSWPFEDWK